MVYKIAAFLFLLLVVVRLNRSYAAKLPTATGPSYQLSKIAYGWEASILEHPYMVNIWVKSEAKINWFLPFLNIPIIKEYEEGSKIFQCGGTLISRKCILTAAHCMFDKYTLRRYQKEMFEFYGGNNIRGKGLLLPEAESVFLDDYDLDTDDKDVAIIKLTEPVEEPNLKTVEIDYSEVNEGDSITVTGWGKSEFSYYSPTLRETNISVTNTEECRSVWRQYTVPRIITENMLCAIGLRKEDSCGGDSGGPIIRSGKQIGIVSFGDPNCLQAKLPAAYTKLNSVRVSKFLRQTIANNC